MRGAAARPGYGRRLVGRGYRMYGNGSSLTVFAPLDMFMVAEGDHTEIIIVDPSLGRQTAYPQGLGWPS